jgi:hypothetical protein
LSPETEVVLLRVLIPLLNLVEPREERDRHEDDDGLLSVTDFDL